MTFNLKKAYTDTQMMYQKQLEKKRQDMSYQTPDEGVTELQLKHNNRKDKDNSVLYNKQLTKSRTGSYEGNTEKAMNQRNKMYNDKRDNRTHNRNAKSQDLVAEAYHQNKLDAFRKSQQGQDRDTSFWDDYVGVQMQGPRTKIVKNKSDSQLPNHPDRYSKLQPDLKQKVDNLVMAQMKHADKMQFQIFAQAAMEERNLNKTEKQMITDINSAKARLLDKYENSMKTSKTAQFDDDFDGWPGDGSGMDDLADFNAYEGDDYDDDEGLVEDETYLTIEPSDTGGYNVVEQGIYGISELSDGEHRIHVIDYFDNIQEAKANYPEAEIVDHKTKDIDNPPENMGREERS